MRQTVPTETQRFRAATGECAASPCELNRHSTGTRVAHPAESSQWVFVEMQLVECLCLPDSARTSAENGGSPCLQHTKRTPSASSAPFCVCAPVSENEAGVGGDAVARQVEIPQALVLLQTVADAASSKLPQRVVGQIQPGESTQRHSQRSRFSIKTTCEAQTSACDGRGRTTRRLNGYWRGPPGTRWRS
jgi:hypothetical protein